MRNLFLPVVIILLISADLGFSSCKKEKDPPPPDPSDNLALDSLVATKANIIVWEEIYVTAYARGKNLNYSWSANHGSMSGEDSVSIKYWACDACVGLNTIKCSISNEYGVISDTIMIRVNP
jgi:hypothetical protein